MKRLPVLAAVALAATTLAPTAAVAAPVPPVQLASDWMAAELTDGLALGTFGPDIGLSIDAGLTFDAIGRTSDADLVGDSIADQLVTSVDVPYGYVSSDEYDYMAPYDFKQVGRYANATAKAAAFTQRIGRDAAIEYAAVDLVAQLEELTHDASGLIADDSFFGNYANTLGQAFAAEALTVAGSTEADEAIAALLDQQCPAGYFRFDLDAAACTTSAAAPSPDTTGIAVVSLISSGNSSPEVLAAVEKATDWFVSVQKADGSLDGGAELPGSNSNSTGLAGLALGLTGHDSAAAKAAAWIRSMQPADVGACASQAPTGAIAYDAADLAAGRADGITSNATVRDKWRRASFQAAPALQWAPVASAPLGISVAAAAVENSTVTATVRGLAAGEQGCVTSGADVRSVVGTGGDLAIAFTLPAGAGARTFTVASLAGTATATLTATTVPVITPPAPAPSDPVMGDLTASRVETVKNNAFKLTVTCASTQSCDGRLKVRTVGKVARANGTLATLLIAKTAYSVDAGEKATVKLTLTKPARALLGTKRVRVAAVQTAAGSEPATTKFWLRRK